MVKGRGSTTGGGDQSTPGGGGGVTETPPTETGLSDDKLETENQESERQAPDVDQSSETVGGQEPRDRAPERIRYRGIATIRRITEDEWKGAGVNDMETVEWNRGNKWCLPVGGEGGLSDNAVNLIKDETEFSVE